MAKDYVGNEIQVNDEVIFVKLGYRCFDKGVISKITHKMLFIKTESDLRLVKQEHEQVIKIIK